MSAVKSCDKCKKEVKRFDIECISCGGTAFSYTYDERPESESSEVFRSYTPEPFGQNSLVTGSFGARETTLADLVKAQNRTTHSVRAFVRFLFIQLSAATIAIFL